MAQSLNTIRSKILTSVHGRRLGIDSAEFLAGTKGVRHVVTNATSDTTGTELPNHGLVSVATTTDDTWVLSDPEPGVEVTLVVNINSTGTHTVDVSPAVIYSTNGLEGDQVLLSNEGAFCKLMGLTTAVWAVTSRASTGVTSISS
jgi:hypothetical protein